MTMAKATTVPTPIPAFAPGLRGVLSASRDDGVVDVAVDGMLEVFEAEELGSCELVRAEGLLVDFSVVSG